MASKVGKRVHHQVEERAWAALQLAHRVARPPHVGGQPAHHKGQGDRREVDKGACDLVQRVKHEPVHEPRGGQVSHALLHTNTLAFNTRTCFGIQPQPPPMGHCCTQRHPREAMRQGLVRARGLRMQEAEGERGGAGLTVPDAKHNHEQFWAVVTKPKVEQDAQVGKVAKV